MLSWHGHVAELLQVFGWTLIQVFMRDVRHLSHAKGSCVGLLGEFVELVVSAVICIAWKGHQNMLLAVVLASV